MSSGRTATMVSSASSASSASTATAKASVAAASASAAPPTDAIEWVEIIEPRTGEHMFANLTTGECVWDPPAGVPVKKTNDNQWWELFDQNTSRFYYYNASSQKTVWHRPTNCDIIPLAKLQTLKQNTEVKDEAAAVASATASEDHGTQTSLSLTLEARPRTLNPLPLGSSSMPSSKKTKLTTSSLSQTSPVDSPRPKKHPKQQPWQQPDSPESRGDAVSPVSGPSGFLSSELQARDRRRTTIGPAQAKYYSIQQQQQPQRASIRDHRQLFGGLSRQKSLDGESFRTSGMQLAGAAMAEQAEDTASVVGGASVGSGGSGGSGSIARSVSFMSRQNNPAAGASWNGRVSADLTPRSARRNTPLSPEKKKSAVYSVPVGASSGNGRRAESVTSPIEGYCTPMIHRKTSSGSVRGLKALLSSSNSKTGEPQSSQNMSITELVDSGLSTLADGAAKSISGEAKHHHQQQQQQQQRYLNRLRGKLEAPSSKMSPLQQYILEQAKLSGYHHRASTIAQSDRDSFVGSEDDVVDRLDDSDDFADDEDGLDTDDYSKASSVDGDEDDVDDDGRYLLSEPTYNNLDPAWIQSWDSAAAASGISLPLGHPHQDRLGTGPRLPPPRASPLDHAHMGHGPRDVDALSDELDVRLRFGGGQRASATSSSSSTMPRPTSHGPSTGNHNNNNHHHQQFMQNPAFPVPYEILHPSLQRHAHSMIEPGTSASAASTGSSSTFSTLRSASAVPPSASLLSLGESDIERYAQDNLNIQKKGLFRKKVTVKDLLSHTKESLRKPLTCTAADKALRKEAIDVFRLVQIYMGDRRAKAGMTINTVALEITTRGYSSAQIRDEILVQLCKQTTENPSKESLRRGWELLALCLAFFPPSTTLSLALHSYIGKHRDPSLDRPDVGRWPIHVQISHYAGICAKRLERIGEGGRLSPKKPSLEDIDQSRLQIFRPSMFGGTLAEIMAVQSDRFPHRRLPWILTTLAEQILQLGGASTEGIFRVPADMEEVASVKSRFDQWEVAACGDCHTAASLLKLWFRELYEPLIPDDLYEACVRAADDATAAAAIVKRLPDLHLHVLCFLVRFLQIFARPDVATVTKMDSSNLGTVFAPNCLRCPSKDPSVILENTRKEMAFVKSLIVNMDTSMIDGVL